MTARRVAWAGTAGALGAALAVALGGCAQPAAPEVSVEVFQLRTDYANRGLQIHVENTGERSVAIESARFESASFVEPAVWPAGHVVDLGPGRGIDLRVELPEAACGGEATASVVLGFVDGGRHAFSPGDPYGQLGSLTDADCALESAQRIVALELDDELEVRGASAAIVVHATPTGAAGTVELVAVRSTTLLTVGDGGGVESALAAVLDGTDEPSEVRIPIEPGRCDAHAIAEDKRGTILPITVRVQAGSDPAVESVVELAASDALKGEIYEWVAATCGL